MSTLAPIEIISVRNVLGEGILWDSRRCLLWWTDIHGRKLHRYDWAHRAIQVYDTPERVCSFGLIAGSDRLITAFATGIALYDVFRQSIEWLARPEIMEPRVRFNDGRVDRQGRFWSGTMMEGDNPAASSCLYSFKGSGDAQCHLREIMISNGLCISPDGRHLYFADSPTREIRVFDLIEPEGLLGPSRVFAQTPEGAYPDGATVDADGCVWSAHWGAGCVVRYTPEGRVDRTIPVPASQPSCLCFAGPDLDIMCVTTARNGLSEAALRAEPNAGDVFMYRPGVQGLPEPEYRL